MQETTNYGFKKPDGIDRVYVDVLNENMDNLDTLIFGVKSKADAPIYYNEIYNTPVALPASDVYPWAKSNKKPSYTAGEVGTLSEDEIDQIVADLQDQIDALASGGGTISSITEAEIDSLFPD